MIYGYEDINKQINKIADNYLLMSWDYGWLKIERRPGRYYFINVDKEEVVKTFQKAWKMAELIENLIKFRGRNEGSINHGRYKFDWEPAPLDHGEININIEIGDKIKIKMFSVYIIGLIDTDVFNKVQNFRKWLARRIDGQYDFNSYFSKRTTNLLKFSASLDPALDRLEELEKKGESIRKELLTLYSQVENQIRRR